MILLTKRINNLLDDSGLPELTIVRQESGTIAIVGRECGKPILNFPSLPVSKKLTAEERTILAVDYIEPVVGKYKKDLVELMSLMKEPPFTEFINSINKAYAKTNGMGVELQTAYDHTAQQPVYTNITVFLPTKHKIACEYNLKFNNWDLEVTLNQVKNLDEMEAITKIVAKFKTEVEDVVKVILEEQKLQRAKTTKILKLQKKMSTKCSI